LAVRIVRRNYSLSELRTLAATLARLRPTPRRLLNLARVKLSSALRLERSLGMPVDLYVEPTGACNYRCLKCAMFNPGYRDDGSVGGNKHLSLERFEQIMDEVADTLLTVRLWHYGEPMLNRALPDMVASAKRRGVFTALNTNASRLDAEASASLIEAGLDYLVVSCDAVSRESYKLYHGVDRYERVMSNLRSFAETRRRLRSRFPFFDLQFILMKENVGEMDRLRKLAADLGANKLSLLALDEGDANYHLDPDVSSKEDLLPADEALRMDWSLLDLSKPCRLPFEQAVLRYSGTVLPCVSDQGHEHVAGSLFAAEGERRSFEEIWNGEAFRSFRRAVARNDGSMPLCDGCPQRNSSTHDQLASDVESRS
jgi:MoaA/NifB/PqqE/SkfB family radical SAM enzyme